MTATKTLKHVKPRFAKKPLGPTMLMHYTHAAGRACMVNAAVTAAVKARKAGAAC